MHPAMMESWRSRCVPSAWSCGPASGCGPGGGRWAGGPWQAGGGYGDDGGAEGGGDPWGGGGGGGGGDGGSAFGVRRPLRFLAYKLELDDAQVAELAKVLNELKTERAQAEVDRRRTVAAFADAVAAAAFDDARAGEGGKLRVDSAERLREAVLTALRRIHALLDDDQRQRLAYLIRTGTLVI